MDIFIYLVLGLLIIYIEIKRDRYFTYDHLSIFNFFFLFSYVIAPIFIHIGGTRDFVNPNLYLGIHYVGGKYTSLIILCSYIIFLLGYYMNNTRQRASNLGIDIRFSTKIVVIVIPIIFVLLAILLYIYISQFGGLRETIALAEDYRNGFIDPPPYAFVKRAFPINTVILFYSYYKSYLEKGEEYRKFFKIVFFISFMIFLFLGIIYNSRSFIIIIIGGLYIITSIYNKDYYIKFLLLGVIGGILVLQFGDPLFGSMSALLNYGYGAFIETFIDIMEHDVSQGFEGIIRNFSHPIVSLEMSLERSGVDIEFRYFVDFINALTSIFPKAIFGFERELSITQINTIYAYGDSIDMVLPGMLASFSYSLGVIGVFIGMFIYGLIGGILSEIFKKLYINYKSSLVFIYILSFTYGSFVFRGDPKIEFQEIFMLTLIIITILTFSKIYSERQYAKI